VQGFEGIWARTGKLQQCPWECAYIIRSWTYYFSDIKQSKKRRGTKKQEKRTRVDNTETASKPTTYGFSDTHFEHPQA